MSTIIIYSKIREMKILMRSKLLNLSLYFRKKIRSNNNNSNNQNQLKETGLSHHHKLETKNNKK